MADYFITTKESRQENSSRKFFFIFILLLLLYFLLGLSQILADEKDPMKFLVTVIYGILISDLLIIILLFQKYISYDNFLTQTPQEWFSSLENIPTFQPSRFCSRFGRIFLIDDSNLKLISNMKNYQFIFNLFYVFLFLFIIISYPMITFDKYIDYLFASIVSLILINLFFYFATRKELNWKFSKVNSFTIKTTIMNDFNLKISTQFSRSIFRSLEIIHTKTTQLFPYSLFSKFYSDKEFLYALVLTIPSYNEMKKNKTIPFFVLCSHQERAFLEIIKKIILKWIDLPSNDY